MYGHTEGGGLKGDVEKTSLGAECLVGTIPVISERCVLWYDSNEERRRKEIANKKVSDEGGREFLYFYFLFQFGASHVPEIYLWAVSLDKKLTYLVGRRSRSASGTRYLLQVKKRTLKVTILWFDPWASTPYPWYHIDLPLKPAFSLIPILNLLSTIIEFLRLRHNCTATPRLRERWSCDQLKLVECLMPG